LLNPVFDAVLWTAIKKYQEQVAKINISGGAFVAKGKSNQDLGWLVLTT